VADKSSLARGQPTNRATVVGLLSEHWGVMLVALAVVGAETVAALLEPWPIKVVLDTVLHAKALPSWLAHAVASRVGTTNASVLAVAASAAVLIALCCVAPALGESSRVATPVRCGLDVSLPV